MDPQIDLIFPNRIQKQKAYDQEQEFQLSVYKEKDFSRIRKIITETKLTKTKNSHKHHDAIHRHQTP